MYFRAKQHILLCTKQVGEYNREQSCRHFTSGLLTCSVSD